MIRLETFDSVINQFNKDNPDLRIDDENLKHIRGVIENEYSDDIVIHITMRKGYSELFVFDPCVEIKGIRQCGSYPLFVKNHRF